MFKQLLLLNFRGVFPLYVLLTLQKPMNGGGYVVQLFYRIHGGQIGCFGETGDIGVDSKKSNSGVGWAGGDIYIYLYTYFLLATYHMIHLSGFFPSTPKNSQMYYKYMVNVSMLLFVPQNLELGTLKSVVFGDPQKQFGTTLCYTLVTSKYLLT